ncbi:MAG: phage terminase large subunit [Burkholderiales bacterium]
MSRAKLKQCTIEEFLAEACCRSLGFFVRKAWSVLEPESQPYQHNWHIDAICEHLEAVAKGEITRLIINVPPGAGKSIITNVFFPAWEWGPRGMPWIRVICASYASALTTRDSLKMRSLITSDWYQSMWQVKLTGDQNLKTWYQNDKTGFRQASPLASMTGHRGDRIILDDPQSVEMSYSKVETEKSIRIFRETVQHRLNNQATSAIIIIMQRLSTQDITATALEIDSGFVHLKIPMEYQPATTIGTRIGWTDPRETENELFFPLRFPRDAVEKAKTSLGRYGAASQFQMDPIPLGGRLINTAGFGFFRVHPRLRYRVIYADTAQKAAEHNDYSVFLCAGLGDDGKVYLLDLIRAKWEAPELDRQARAFWAKHRAIVDITMGSLRAMRIEDAASGTGLIQAFRKIPPLIPVDPITRHKDKLTRFTDALPWIDAGFVRLPEGASWVSDFLRECQELTPTDSHPHDDQCDVLADAISDMLGNNKVDVWRKIA